VNRKFLWLLCCPHCLAALELGKSNKAEESSDGVRAGILKCRCGATYPIVDYVPRFPSTEGNALSAGGGNKLDKGQPMFVPSRYEQNDYENIRKSFSREWQLFDYAKDKTWGRTLEDRRHQFLNEIGLAGDELRGKLLLDAGCGNGTLTAALALFGMEVIGVDLNEGLGVISSSKALFAGKESEHVQFVQGNLFYPPFRQSSFDMVYCSGVIHHTPNPSETFKRLVPLVKRGGRLYVYVYSKRNFSVRIYQYCGRQLKNYMSLESVLTFCRFIAPAYKTIAGMLSSLGIMDFRRRTVREITLDLFDAFSPKYNYAYREDEIKKWFEDCGFTSMSVSYRDKNGFGVRGVKT
jgi:2-polyprenyl-3-methyl-5-hydroxy-6-metoxy-1,4-benzoquinol methylase/uncharacterized protein YbaR (Trm112 family)